MSLVDEGAAEPVTCHLVVRRRARPPARVGSVLLLTLLAGCGLPTTTPISSPGTVTLPGTAAVKVESVAEQGWIVLVEILQEQLLVTMPRRRLVWLDADLKVIKEYTPPEGRFLIDFSVHPSGAATVVELEPIGTDLFLKPIKAQLTRFLASGSQVTLSLDPGLPELSSPLPFLFSLDRARIAPSGEDDLGGPSDGPTTPCAHIRSRSGREPSTFRGPPWWSPPRISCRLESSAADSTTFTRVTATRSSTSTWTRQASGTVAPSTADVLPAHDAFFHEDLVSGADEPHFDYGISIITRLSPEGHRTYGSCPVWGPASACWRSGPRPIPSTSRVGSGWGAIPATGRLGSGVRCAEWPCQD